MRHSKYQITSPRLSAWEHRRVEQAQSIAVAITNIVGRTGHD